MKPRTEREAKLWPSPEFEISGLTDAVEGTSLELLPHLELVATYYDTPDLTLARWGITVRYRTGESPDRWTVKLPAGSTDHALVRREIDLDGPGHIRPLEVDALLAAHLRGRTLSPVAVITTSRTRVLLNDEAGRALVEVAYDLVTVDGRGPGPTSWEEIEVEAVHPTLGAGALDRTVRALRDRGCRRTLPVPKLVRALGEAASEPPDVIVPDLPPKPRAQDALTHALARSVHQILDHDPRVRLGGDPEDLHQLRVAVRRLRSDLRSLSGAVDASDRLADELRWVAGETSVARDLDVLLGWLQATGASLDDSDGPGVESLQRRCELQQAEQHAVVREALASTRYLDLLDDLVGLVTTPVRLTKADDAGLRRRLRRQCRRQWRKLGTRMAALGADPSNATVHRARIAAKRCRAAAEALAPLDRHAMNRFAHSLAELQDVLGAAHDAAVMETWLREAARTTAAFEAGELAATARADGVDQLRRWPTTWARVRRRGRHL